MNYYELIYTYWEKIKTMEHSPPKEPNKVRMTRHDMAEQHINKNRTENDQKLQQKYHLYV